jgi:hypothetical protein
MGRAAKLDPTLIGAALLIICGAGKNAQHDTGAIKFLFNTLKQE